MEIKVTMDRYVRITDESLVKENRPFESSAPNKLKKVQKRA